jgi:hypothetical protein
MVQWLVVVKAVAKIRVVQKAGYHFTQMCHNRLSGTGTVLMLYVDAWRKIREITLYK